MSALCEKVRIAPDSWCNVVHCVHHLQPFAFHVPIFCVLLGVIICHVHRVMYYYIFPLIQVTSTNKVAHISITTDNTFTEFHSGQIVSPSVGLTFLMRWHKIRSTRDRTIPRSLERWVSTKSSISHLTSFHLVIIYVSYLACVRLEPFPSHLSASSRWDTIQHERCPTEVCFRAVQGEWGVLKSCMVVVV